MSPCWRNGHWTKSGRYEIFYWKWWKIDSKQLCHVSIKIIIIWISLCFSNLVWIFSRINPIQKKFITLCCNCSKKFMVNNISTTPRFFSEYVRPKKRNPNSILTQIQNMVTWSRHRPNLGLIGRLGFPWVPFRLNQKIRGSSPN